MSYLKTELISHTRKVCSLYKRSIRNLEAWCDKDHDIFRYNAIHMRQRFEEHRKELDMRKAKELLANGEEELFQKLHYQPLKFPNSPGGVAYAREPPVPDWLIDTWHPAEKAQYPDYFARREQRKKEYIAMWEKQYGKPDPEEHHH